MTLGPGVSGARSAITHSGEEFVYVLDGTLMCEISEQEYALETGDSLLFLATQPHVYRNNSDTEARMLVVFLSATGQTRSPPHHLA
jgi:uncharacterized cupin superfamily protein